MAAKSKIIPFCDKFNWGRFYFPEKDGNCFALNHVLFGDISRRMIRTFAGIRPDEENPGFRHYFVRSQGVGELRFVRATVPTPHGLIHVEWRRDGDKFTLSLTQPEGCAATVTLPDGSCHDARLPRMFFTSAAEPVPVTPRSPDIEGSIKFPQGLIPWGLG